MTTENVCLFCDILISYRFLWIKFVCLFIRTVSCFILVIEPSKENITLENNNVLETLLKTV